MSELFGFLAFVSFLALIVGLIKPSWLRMPSRKRVGMVFGGATLASFILFAIVAPPAPAGGSEENLIPTSQPAHTQAVNDSVTHSASATTAAGGPAILADISIGPSVVQAASDTTSPAPSSVNTNSSNPTASGECVINGAYPDPHCTPGAAFPNVTAAEVCTSGYSSSVRDVSASEKDQVYAEYGITSRTTGQYEVDHFISLELGGSNDITNLWPEAALPTPGFHEKDEVENYLHGQLCSGQITLAQAQKEISTGWLAVYNSVYGGGSAPSASSTSDTSIQATSSASTGATAQCNDGTYSYSQTHSGTCSHHGGVATWY